jgi:ferredoxin
MTLKVTLEQDKCVASGQCVTAAGSVFDQRDEDGIAILLDAQPAPELEDEVRHAAAVCPVLAIHVHK